jgi:4'-phosphopantetheinyl transferase
MLKVYYSDISNCVLDDNLIATLPKERREYVCSINDVNRRKQSLFVWKLLETALKDNDIEASSFTREKSGEWVSCNSEIKFSLSHSNNIVAVSISDANVGVDVERCSEKLLKVKGKLLDNKLENCSVDLLAKLWTEKESKYKAKIDGIMSNITIFEGTNKYILSVCGSESVIDSQIYKINLQ